MRGGRDSLGVRGGFHLRWRENKGGKEREIGLGFFMCELELDGLEI